MIIFEKSQKNRFATAQVPLAEDFHTSISSHLLRQDPPLLPELSELEVVRHYTQLSQFNYCIDTQFYPLGSCTMKYNPRGIQQLAQLDPFLMQHPLLPTEYSQGILACLYDLQSYLQAITGMAGVSLTPMAGAQGELAGIAMIRAYHTQRNDIQRTEMLVQDAAHGTNPATAAMCGYQVKVVPTLKNGDMDLDALQGMVSEKTAGIMLTNPSTLGVFDRNIQQVAALIHAVGGLLYYDGANLNAILGKVKPAKMGFDVMHMNLHKTFATPHGGGGPGSGPVAANEKLLPFLPIPRVGIKAKQFVWLDKDDCTLSIGRLSTFMGNVGILLRAYLYIRLLGKEGLKRVARFAVLNANYLRAKLKAIGYTVCFTDRFAAHEFIITLSKEMKTAHISAMDVAKALLDEGMYAPTVYFPQLIPECLLIEPTETESKQTLDAMVVAMNKIWQHIHSAPQQLLQAPCRLPFKRIDEVKAAREIALTWKKEGSIFGNEDDLG